MNGDTRNTSLARRERPAKRNGGTGEPLSRTMVDRRDPAVTGKAGPDGLLPAGTHAEGDIPAVSASRQAPARSSHPPNQCREGSTPW